jgi:hypothetical protein
MKSAVLFIVFNRPDTSLKVFETIRAARPPRLYISADGPRANRENEAALCESVRAIAKLVDWDCQLFTRFMNINVGCKAGVTGAINWFFENEQEGIILEDDVVPHASFFPYMDALLEKHRDDDKVRMVSGSNLIAPYFAAETSYVFSRYTHIWGWGTWRRSWSKYDVKMSDWSAVRETLWLEEYLSDCPDAAAAKWRQIFDAVWMNMIDTWDYQWTYSCWRDGGVCALPKINLVKNIGFGADATHTTMAEPDLLKLSVAAAIDFPIIGPLNLERNLDVDRLTERVVLGQ